MAEEKLFVTGRVRLGMTPETEAIFLIHRLTKNICDLESDVLEYDRLFGTNKTNALVKLICEQLVRVASIHDIRTWTFSPLEKQ